MNKGSFDSFSFDIKIMLGIIAYSKNPAIHNCHNISTLKLVEANLDQFTHSKSLPIATPVS
jgi:hypothetical protein